MPFITDQCGACGQCEEVCPSKAMYYPSTEGKSYKSPVIDQDKCIGCLACVKVCPKDAISTNYIMHHPV